MVLIPKKNSEVALGRILSCTDGLRETVANRVVSKQQVIDLVVIRTGIAEKEMFSQSRKRERVVARQVAMFLIYRFSDETLKTIGKHFGDRDHTTVIHSLQTVQDLMDTDPDYRRRVESMIYELEGKEI